ncbi:MAG: sugar phosphate isomerase/epimerase [Clostridia bacterium]|nr:sugar phosphate isomerase/epimerase [Clostridia bacterium]
MKIATTIGEAYAYTSSPAEAVRMYEGTGFRWLDYSFYNANRPGSVFLTEDWLKEVNDAGEAAAALGFAFVQAHSPNYNPYFDPNDTAYHEAGMLATRRSIEACGRLGIPNIVVHTAYGPQCQYPDDKEKYFATNMPFITALYPEIEKWNVRVCIENSAEGNMGKNYFFMTAEDMNDFIDYAGHPLIGACWDTGHGNMRGTDPYRELVTLGKNLCAIHFQDNSGNGDEHIAPFLGTLNVDAVMRGLIDAGYTGPLTFESDNFCARRKNRGDGILQYPPKRVKKAALSMLHEIGAACLEAYGIEEN